METEKLVSNSSRTDRLLEQQDDYQSHLIDIHHQQVCGQIYETTFTWLIWLLHLMMIIIIKL